MTPQAPRTGIKRVGVVDTTFSRVNMGRIAIDTIGKHAPGRIDVQRVTVPGVKDLPAASRHFFDNGCDLVIACGMVGPEEVDKTCGHEASLGLMWIRANLGKPLLEVFIHMDEAKDDGELKWLAERRTEEHAENACWMLLDPQKLVEMAGTGQRQGFEDAGPVPHGDAS